MKMRCASLLSLASLAFAAHAAMAQQPSTDGPYKVVKSARVGGEGGTDYIYADQAHPNTLVPGAILIESDGGAQILRIP